MRFFYSKILRPSSVRKRKSCGAVRCCDTSYGADRYGFEKWKILRCRSVRFSKIVNGMVRFFHVSYGAVWCGFHKSGILWCGSVRLSDIVNLTVQFGAVKNPTERFGAVPRLTVFATVRGYIIKTVGCTMCPVTIYWWSNVRISDYLCDAKYCTLSSYIKIQ